MNTSYAFIPLPLEHRVRVDVAVGCGQRFEDIASIENHPFTSPNPNLKSERGLGFSALQEIMTQWMAERDGILTKMQAQPQELTAEQVAEAIVAQEEASFREFAEIVLRRWEYGTCAIILYRADRKRSLAELKDAFVYATDTWLETDAGKRAMTSAADDLNIGDLAVLLDDNFKFALRVKGIDLLDIETIDGSDARDDWHFDDHLFTEEDDA